MYRLKCNGKPILTSIQFYKEAKLSELLRQREAFLSFAGSHLNLDGRNYHIFMLQEVFLKPQLIKGNQWKVDLRNKLCDDPKLINELESVWKDVQNYFSKTSFSSSAEKDTFLVITTLSILISKLNPSVWKKESPEDLVNAYRGKSIVKEKNNAIQFRQNQTFTLSPLEKPYAVSYNPNYPMKNGQKIKTYIIEAASVGTYDCVILSLGKQEQRKIPQGECLLVNVVENTIVSFLPGYISAGGTRLERKANGSIYLNGKRCPHTQNVTTFSVQKTTGLYFWSDDGKLDGSFLDNNPNCGKYVQRIVEVAFYKDYYYLLSADGMLDSNDPIRKTVNRPLASLGALRKELIT